MVLGVPYAYFIQKCVKRNPEFVYLFNCSLQSAASKLATSAKHIIYTFNLVTVSDIVRPLPL